MNIIYWKEKRIAVSFMISELWATWISQQSSSGKSWYCVLRVWFSTQGRDETQILPDNNTRK